MENTERLPEVICPHCGASNPSYWYCSCLPRTDGLDRILVKRDEEPKDMQLSTVQISEEKEKNSN